MSAIEVIVKKKQSFDAVKYFSFRDGAETSEPFSPKMFDSRL